MMFKIPIPEVLKKRKKSVSTLPDELEYFRLVPLPLLHPLFHGCDDGVGLILGSVFGRLFSSPCETH